jgi:Uma2 family endonuclease
VVIVPGSRTDYLLRHPTAADARLVIEVSDTTLRYDRKQKQSAYARAGIPEYWILNLLHRQVEVYRDPAGSRYRSRTISREGEVLTPVAAPHASIRVSDLLPPLPASDNG